MDNLDYLYLASTLLTQDVEKPIQELIGSCFSMDEKTAQEKKEHNDKFCSIKDKIGYAIAFSGPEVIGVVTTYKRKVIFNNEIVTLGGLGGVCTKEEMRRKGIASGLIKMAMEKLQEEDCDVAYLCTDTDKLGGLYKAAGFKELKVKYTYLGRSGKRYFDSGGMIAAITNEKLFQNILKSDHPFDIGTGDW